MPWWALGYVALWVVSLVGGIAHRRRMQCSLPRFAASSIAGAIAMFFVFAFWYPELTDRIWRFLPVMFAYMLASDVSMMMWVVPVAQRELEDAIEEDADDDEDPETEEARQVFLASFASSVLPLAIFVVLLFLLPAYVLAVRVCLR